MDLIDLGFADITPEREETDNDKYMEESNLIRKLRDNKEITGEEWFELEITLREKYGYPYDPRLLTSPRISQIIEKNVSLRERIDRLNHKT